MGYKENSITNPFLYITKQIRKIYLNSSIYNNKISKVFNGGFEYIPHLKIFDCIVKINDRKQRIEDYKIESVWENKDIPEKDFKKLHSFFWLFSIDLKSSNRITQSIIEDWIDKNIKYNDQNWEVDILSKRIISWISNSKLTYEDSSVNYKYKFNFVIQKQINHLINEINRSESVDESVDVITYFEITSSLNINIIYRSCLLYTSPSPRDS